MTSLKIIYKLKNSNHWEYFICLLFFSLGCLIQGNLIPRILKRKRQTEEWCIVTGILFLLPLPTTQHCCNAPATHRRGYGTITTDNPHGLWWANLLLSDLNHLRRLHTVYRTHMVILLGLSLLEEATLPARNFSPLEVILSISSAPRDLKAFSLSQEVLVGNTDTISISRSITREVRTSWKTSLLCLWSISPTNKEGKQALILGFDVKFVKRYSICSYNFRDKGMVGHPNKT